MNEFRTIYIKGNWNWNEVRVDSLSKLVHFFKVKQEPREANNFN